MKKMKDAPATYTENAPHDVSINGAAINFGCVIHSKESADAIIAVAHAAEQNARAILTIAKSLSRVAKSVTVNGHGVNIGNGKVES